MEENKELTPHTNEETGPVVETPEVKSEEKPQTSGEKPDAAPVKESESPEQPPKPDTAEQSGKQEEDGTAHDAIVLAELAALKDVLGSTKKEVEELKDAVVGSFKETTDRMHEKLQKYDKGLEASLRKPLIDEIIEICDGVEKNIREVGDDAELALKKLRELPEVIKSVLYNHGVEEYQVQAGQDAFNPRRHRGIKPIPTDDESLDGIVKDVYCTGYMTGAGTDAERVYRTAWVSVYKKNKQ